MLHTSCQNTYRHATTMDSQHLFVAHAKVLAPFLYWVLVLLRSAGAENSVR